MNNYAIIKIGPFQYTVEEGMEYTVPKFEAVEGKKMNIEDVLAVGTDKGLNVGTPTVAGGKVTLDIIEQGKGKKTVTRRFKAKSRYRRTSGHRPRVTKFKVEKITVGKAATKATKAKSTTKKAKTKADKTKS